LFVEINIGAAYQDFVSDVLILEDGTFLTSYKFYQLYYIIYKKVKQSRYRPRGFHRKLRFPDFKTTAQDGGKVVSLTHRPSLPQEITWY
jgi:hypothetical protein